MTRALWLLALLACDGSPHRQPPQAPVTETTPPETTPTTTDPGPRPRLLLHGGGPEDDVTLGWLVEAGGYGHIVTLGARDPSDPDLTWFDDTFVALGAASAETVNARTPAEARAPAALAALEHADAVWIRGGDQALYLSAWQGTPLESALRDAVDRGVVVGGTSAGCAVLGGRIYDARVASVASWEALLDPLGPGLTFSEPLIDVLPHVLTDTHFTERGRLGRLAVFMARWQTEGGGGTLGVGVDPETALLVYDDGTAEVVGRGSVTLLDPHPSRAVLTAGQPPDIRGQRLWQLPAGYTVDLGDPTDPVRSRPPWVSPTPPPPPIDGWATLALDGNDLAQRALGSVWIPNLDADPYGWYDGELELATGESLLPGTLVVTGLYESSATFENHQGGMAWALAQHPHLVALGVDIDLTVHARPPASLEVPSGSYALVLDGRTATHAGLPPADGWQTAALEGVTLHVVGRDTRWDAAP